MEGVMLGSTTGPTLGVPSWRNSPIIVIGESIIAGTPVVAYDIPNYRPLFGDFVRYAPPFETKAALNS